MTEDETNINPDFFRRVVVTCVTSDYKFKYASLNSKTIPKYSQE